MNGSLAANAALVAGIKEGLAAQACDVAVCVPAPYLAQVQALVAGSPVGLGAQDMSAHASGAYTGEVSASMLQEFGVQYVILGHSERRAYHGESDAAVAAKTVAALKAGLVPLVCVGETLEQREAGQTNAVVGGQLDVVLAALSAEEAARIVVAYEPVWQSAPARPLRPRWRRKCMRCCARVEALLIDLKQADRGHCLMVDIRSQYARSKRRLIMVENGEQRGALNRIGRLFEDVDCGPSGPEGNYRQRLYRLKTVLPQSDEEEEREERQDLAA